MKVVGLCGGSGSGKGTVCSFFAELGVKCIDTDMIYHTIISTDSECVQELISHFGEQIHANPGIDRKQLRLIAFASAENLKQLNLITHKHILNVVRSEIAKTKNDGTASGILIDAPLLFESGFDQECDATLAVIAENSTRINRIVSRDGISRDLALTRISAQIPNDVLISKCDYVITNDSTFEELRRAVCDLNKTLFDNFTEEL